MNPNNEVWWEVAKGRADNARQWQQQEQFIKATRISEPGPGRRAAPNLGAAAANILTAAKKLLASLKPAPVEPRESVREKPKSYA